MGSPHLHPSIQSLGFLATSAEEMFKLLDDTIEKEGKNLICEYFSMGLPPVTSIQALSVAFGYHPGFIHSLLNNTKTHYRNFSIPKGKGYRKITAPKVGLKMVQRWMAYHFTKKWIVPEYVFGFVPGRSHLQAAHQHLGAEWVFSCDIKNFFPSVTDKKVEMSLKKLGYKDLGSINNIIKLTCIDGGLAQGAPTSPIISNIALSDLDREIANLADTQNFVFTRYADDIVCSGKGKPSFDIEASLLHLISRYGWEVAEQKTAFLHLPRRLKVHGLLVHGDKIRLTKGYRNKIRLYKYAMDNEKAKKDERAKLAGHIQYAHSVENFSE